MSYLCDRCHYSQCSDEPCPNFMPEHGPGTDENHCVPCGHGPACHPTRIPSSAAAGARTAAVSRANLAAHHETRATKHLEHPLLIGTIIRSLSGEEDGNGSSGPGEFGVVIAYLGNFGGRQGHAYQVQFPLQKRAEAPDDPEAIVVEVILDEGDDLDDSSCYQVEPSTTPEVPLLPADRLGVMLAMADLAYREHMDEGLPDPGTAHEHSWGNLLADFITTEIQEVSEGSGEPLHEAITAIGRAVQELSDVHQALIRLADRHPHAGGPPMGDCQDVE